MLPVLPTTYLNTILITIPGLWVRYGFNTTPQDVSGEEYTRYRCVSRLIYLIYGRLTHPYHIQPSHCLIIISSLI